MKELFVIDTDRTDPYHNLALEELLLHRVQPGQCILYLWQNQHTVVIGRNQNAENECRVQALEADGGRLARRLSGGGAVYHDLGNLNFTFLVSTEDYDVEKQTEVILRAVQMAGVHAEKTGRNDLTVDGRKFSGHAYYRTGDKSYHHGTLMVDVDKEPLAKYLSASPLKLKAKGVQSVRSRVANLVEFNPGLTIAELKKALVAAFEEVYGLPARELCEDELDRDRLEAGRARFASPEWKYGSARPLENSREERFGWGTVRLDFSLENGVIGEAALWSDGLEADFLERVPDLLKGCPLNADAVRTRLRAENAGDPAVVADLVSLLVSE